MAGSIELDAFVDSQEGADHLEIWLDGVLQTTRSGFHQGGRISVPVAAGTHTVRFAYSKDASVDVGLDTAWVDNVKFVSNTALFEHHTFATAVGCDVLGWTRGGHSGGWCATLGPERREWRRPEAMAFVGYQPSPEAYGVARDIAWPTNTDQNELAVAYAVDCEPDNDFFRIRVDGVEQFRVSGREKRGIARVPVTSGTHQVILEYYKDESVDEGFDEARIHAMEIRSQGVTIAYGGLDGSAVGELPRGWDAVASGTSNPAIWWHVTNRSLSPIQIVSDDKVRIADGKISRSEYQATVSLQDGLTGGQTKLWLASSLLEHLTIGIELPAPLGDWFASDGKLAVMIDPVRPSSPYVLDCGPDITYPGPSARRIELSPTAAGGTSVSEQVGTCGASSGTWRDATPAESWPVSFAVVDAEDDVPGALYIELEIGAGSPAGLDPLSPIAFGLVANSPLAGGADEPFLRYPDLGLFHVSESDTSTWRILHRWPGLPNL